LQKKWLLRFVNSYLCKKAIIYYLYILYI
jgi:hypothetical protein